MNRRRWLGLIALIAGALPFLLVLPASAAGPDHVQLSVSRKVLFSGDQLDVSVRAQTPCDLVVQWNGERRHTYASSFSTTFTAPVVTRITRLTLQATCFYTGSRPRPATHPANPARTARSASQLVLVTVPPSWTKTVTIKVLPPGSGVSPPETGSPHPGSGLPGTGGPSRWAVMLGLLTALTGAVLIGWSTRRERSAAIATEPA